MEHASPIFNNCDNVNYMRYIGYQDINCYKDKDSVENFLFSDENINKMSIKITDNLKGVSKHNKSIKVPDKTIRNVLSQVFTTYSPEIGDMYSRDMMYKDNNYTNSIIDKVIDTITSQVSYDIGMINCNNKLTKWTTVLGDFNRHNLQSHSKIKLRENKPPSMLFNMNY